MYNMEKTTHRSLYALRRAARNKMNWCLLNRRWRHSWSHGRQLPLRGWCAAQPVALSYGSVRGHPMLQLFSSDGAPTTRCRVDATLRASTCVGSAGTPLASLRDLLGHRVHCASPRIGKVRQEVPLTQRERRQARKLPTMFVEENAVFWVVAKLCFCCSFGCKTLEGIVLFSGWKHTSYMALLSEFDMLRFFLAGPFPTAEVTKIQRLGRQRTRDKEPISARNICFAELTHGLCQALTDTGSQSQRVD